VADVFISYSRHDAAYVARLARDLESRGKDVWMDVEGIRDAEAFPAALRRAIEGSDAFLFVISPDSVRSQFCEQEVAHASELNKRIVPLALREVPDEEIPDEIRFRSWIPAADGASVGRVLAALETDLEWEHQHTRLTVKALEWDHSERDRSFLLRGADLAAAERWFAAGAGRDPGPTELEQAYLLAGRNAAQRRQRTLVGVSLVVAAISIGLLIFGLISRGQAIGARNTAQNEAHVALARQLGAEAVSEPRIDVAMLLAREAMNLDRSPQTESTLLATLLRTPAVIGTIALPQSTTAALTFSPDGRTLAAGDGLGELRLFDARTRQLTAPALGDLSGNPPAYSDDGTLLAYHSSEYFLSGFIIVRDAHTLQEVANLQLPPGSVAPFQPNEIPSGSIVIAPDDRTVYYAYWLLNSSGQPTASYVQRWALPSGQAPPPATVGSSALLAVRLIDAGSRLLIVSTKNVEVFDARSMRPVSNVSITPVPVVPAAAAISPDGRVVVIGSRGGSVSFIDTATGRARPAAAGQLGAVASVLYAADGRTVVSVGNDGTAIVWNPEIAKPNEVLTGPPGQVAGAALSPDGSTLYTSSLGGPLLEWDLAGQRRFGNRSALGPVARCCDSVPPPEPPVALSPDGSRFAARLGASTVGVFSSRSLTRLSSFTIGSASNVITALAWSPGGDQLAVGGHSGLVQLWSTRGASRLLRSLVGPPSPIGAPNAVQSVAFSPDAKLIAASEDAKTGAVGGGAPTGDYASAAIWRANTGRLVASPPGLNAASSGGGPADDLLAFSPDDKLLALSTFDGSTQILDASNGRLVQALPTVAGTTALTFAPNGTLATGTPTGSVEMWNPVTGKQIGSLLVVAAAPVTTVAFDPSGQRFATAGLGEGTVKLWFTGTLRQQGSTLSTEPGATSSAAFEPHGDGLVAVDDHGTGFAWPTSLPSWEHQACMVAGRNLTRQEWSELIIGQAYGTVCPELARRGVTSTSTK
jgi:WD40 repeat protein